MRLIPILLAAAVAACAVSPDRSGRVRSFATLVAELSEPAGYFDTDNLISNEASYLHAVGELAGRGLAGGAYVGVGPDQNFSYIAALRPAVAVIVDIRRDNMLEHLLFKALFALAPTRQEYLALLLGLSPMDARGPPGEPVDSLLERLGRLAPTDASIRRARRHADSMIATFGVPLSPEDRRTIERFHRTFIRDGLHLRFQSHGRAPLPYYPTLERLLAERDLAGRQVSYVASDAAYRTVRDLQLRDRIVPVTGDFAGRHALRAVGRHLESLGEPVRAFYVSNVEYYLFGDGTFSTFVANLRALPLAEDAVIIRSVFRGPFGRRHPLTRPGYASVQLVSDAGEMLERHGAGRIGSYGELVTPNE